MRSIDGARVRRRRHRVDDRQVGARPRGRPRAGRGAASPTAQTARTRASGTSSGRPRAERLPAAAGLRPQPHLARTGARTPGSDAYSPAAARSADIASRLVAHRPHARTYTATVTEAGSRPAAAAPSAIRAARERHALGRAPVEDHAVGDLARQPHRPRTERGDPDRDGALARRAARDTARPRRSTASPREQRRGPPRTSLAELVERARRRRRPSPGRGPAGRPTAPARWRPPSRAACGVRDRHRHDAGPEEQVARLARQRRRASTSASRARDLGQEHAPCSRRPRPRARSRDRSRPGQRVAERERRCRRLPSASPRAGIVACDGAGALHDRGRRRARGRAADARGRRRAGSAVICHAHPRHGGSKDHPILWAIRNELAAARVRRPRLQLPRHDGQRRHLRRRPRRGRGTSRPRSAAVREASEGPTVVVRVVVRRERRAPRGARRRAGRARSR